MSARAKLLLGALIFGGLALLAACGNTPRRAAIPARAAASPSPTISPSPTAPAPTPSPLARPTAALPTATPHALPSPQASPFAPVFPTPGPTPPAPWRPPMYPVPWAPTPHDHFLLARPIPAFYGALAVTDYRFGGLFFKSGEVHTGIDIPGKPGTPVLAAGDGQVIWANYGFAFGRPGKRGPYGKAIVIRHTFGWHGYTIYTLYAHLSEIAVKPGWWVKAGEPIGRMGNTGHVTGPHLHFEVRLGKPTANSSESSVSMTLVNPELWLVPPIGWGVIAGRVLDDWGRPVSHATVFISSLEDENFRWRTYTYANSPLIHSDDYYRENYTFSDLPAGKYRLSVYYQGAYFRTVLTVRAGEVTTFRFHGWSGFTEGK